MVLRKLVLFATLLLLLLGCLPPPVLPSLVTGATGTITKFGTLTLPALGSAYDYATWQTRLSPSAGIGATFGVMLNVSLISNVTPSVVQDGAINATLQLRYFLLNAPWCESSNASSCASWDIDIYSGSPQLSSTSVATPSIAPTYSAFAASCSAMGDAWAVLTDVQFPLPQRNPPSTQQLVFYEVRLRSTSDWVLRYLNESEPPCPSPEFALTFEGDVGIYFIDNRSTAIIDSLTPSGPIVAQKLSIAGSQVDTLEPVALLYRSGSASFMDMVAAMALFTPQLITDPAFGALLSPYGNETFPVATPWNYLTSAPGVDPFVTQPDTFFAFVLTADLSNASSDSPGTWSASDGALATQNAFACAVEAFATNASQTGTWCRIPITGANVSYRNTVVVSVTGAVADFEGWSDDVVLTLVSPGNDTVSPLTFTCNESARYVALGRGGAVVQCQAMSVVLPGTATVYAALDVFVAKRTAFRAAGPYPPLGSDNERWAFAVIVAFATSEIIPTTLTCSITSFMCPFRYTVNDAGCINVQQVCDGVLDCIDGSDEIGCSNQTLFALGYLPASAVCAAAQAGFSSYVTDIGVTSAAGCRSAAIAYTGIPSGQVVGSFAAGAVWTWTPGATCVLYDSSCAAALVSSGIALVNAGNNITQLHVMQGSMLTAAALDQGTCTASWHCSSRGSLLNMGSLDPPRSCVCACFPGSIGQWCNLSTVASNAAVLQLTGANAVDLEAQLAGIRTQFPIEFFYPVVTFIKPGDVSQSILIVSASFDVVSRYASSTNVVLSAASQPLVPRRSCSSTAPPYVRCNFDYYVDPLTHGTAVDWIVEMYEPNNISDANITYFMIDGGTGTPLSCIRTMNFTDPTTSTCNRVTCSGTLPVSAVRLAVSYAPQPLSCTPPQGESVMPRAYIVAPFEDAVTVATYVSQVSSTPLVLTVTTSAGTVLIVFCTLLGLAFVTLVIAGVFFYKDHSLYKQAKLLGGRGQRFRIPSARTIGSEWGFRVLNVVDRYGDRPFASHYDRVGYCFSIIGIILCFGGLVAGAFYVFPLQTPTSNYMVLLATYKDSACDQSSVTSRPVFVRTVEASNLCLETESAGWWNTSAIRAMQAVCNLDAQTVTLLMGWDATCTSQEVNIPLAQCINASTYLPEYLADQPEEPFSGFIKVLCLPVDAAQDAFLQAESTLEAVSKRVELLPAVAVSAAAALESIPSVSYSSSPAAHQQSVSATSRFGTYFAFEALRSADGVTELYSSSEPCRFISHSNHDPAVAGLSPLDYYPPVIVSQQTSTFSLDMRLGESVTLLEELNVQPALRNYPTLPDLPVGRLFNIPIPGHTIEAGTELVEGTLLFPNILPGSNADLSFWAAPTLGFFIKASNTTKGFVLALADDVRVLRQPAQPGFELPVLDLLVRAVEGGQQGNAFSGTNINVYIAVYVDGERNVISLHSYHPDAGLADIDVVFNLDDLAVYRVFTNTWHYIAFQFSTNSVTLSVDSEFTQLSRGWSACLVRSLELISVSSSAITLLSSNNIPATVYPYPALIVGSLSGAGLYGVEFIGQTMALYEIASRGTMLMTSFQPANKTAFFITGFYLLFIALCLTLVMLAGIVTQYLDTAEDDRRANWARAERIYESILGVHGEASNAVVVGGKEFTALRLPTAVQLTGLDAETFAIVLEEIHKLAFSNIDARCDLLAFLWAQGKRSFVPPPRLKKTYEQWKDVDGAVLSEDGDFTLPCALWEQLVRQHDGEIIRRRGPAAGTGGANPSEAPKASPDARAGGSVADLVQVIIPVALALQTVSVYATSFKFPTIYTSNLQSTYSGFALDWLAFIPSLSVFVSTAVLFGVALLVMGLFVYYALSDHRQWLSMAARYVQRRDLVDRADIVDAMRQRTKMVKQRNMTQAVRRLSASVGPTGILRRKSTTVTVHAKRDSTVLTPKHVVMKDTPDAAADADGPHADAVHEWLLPLLRYVIPPRISVAIDQHVDGAREENTVQLQKEDLLPAESGADRLTWIVDVVGENSVRVGVPSDPAQRRIELKHVGCKCPHHSKRWLSLIEQTDLTEDTYNCFVVTSGVRCQNDRGKMYVCGHVNPDGSRCPYALCGDHAKQTLKEFFVILAVSGLRTLKGLGFHGVVAFLALEAVNFIYFPVVSACISFLSCDARFQCNFDTCWSDADIRFIVGATGVIIIALVIGVGIPLAQFGILLSRGRHLYRIFFHRDYYRHYLAVDKESVRYAQELQRQQEEDDEIDEDEEDAAFKIMRRISPTVSTSLTKTTVDAYKHTVPRIPRVSLGEWRRFLSFDNSFMYPMYYILQFEFIWFPPIILLQKIAVLAPSVLIEDATITQLAVFAVVAVVFALFIFWSRPYLNPWVDTVFRAGCIQDVGLLGMIALSRYLTAIGQGGLLDSLMLAWTLSYLIFVMVLLVATVVFPTIQTVRQMLAVANQMSRVGMRTMDLSSLFLNPLIHKENTLTADERSTVDRRVHKLDEPSTVVGDGAKDTPQRDTERERSVLRSDIARRRKVQEQRDAARRLVAVESTRIMASEL